MMRKAMWLFMILSWVCLVACIGNINDSSTFTKWYAGWFGMFAVGVLCGWRVSVANKAVA